MSYSHGPWEGQSDYDSRPFEDFTVEDVEPDEQELPKPMPEPNVFVTNSLKRDLARVLERAWRRYVELFGDPPSGTSNQMRALVEVMKLDALVDGIANHAVARWYAEGQGSSNNPQNTSLDEDPLSNEEALAELDKELNWWW